jgi:glutathione transport system substrate-binding protein
VFDMMRQPSAKTPEAPTALALFALGPGAGTAFYADSNYNSYGGTFQTAGSVTTYWQNQKVDELLEQVKGVQDETQQLQIYADVQKIVWDEAPWIFLHYLDQSAGAIASLNNLVMTPNEFWFFEKAWLA